MSNNVLGAIYASVIDEVINTSRVDFEEQGVDEAILESMRTMWQSKLTHLGVAAFPWDPPAPPPAPVEPVRPAPTPAPAPAPAPVAAPVALAPAAPAPVPQQAPQGPQGLNLPTVGGGSGGVSGNGNGSSGNGPHIKVEPDINLPTNPPRDSSSDRQEEAATRAAQHLKTVFGHKASNSIQAIHSRGLPPRASTPGAPAQVAAYSMPPLPQMHQQQQDIYQQQQHQIQQHQMQQQHQIQQHQMQHQMQQPQQPQHQSQQQEPADISALGAAQTDGHADDYEGVMMQRGPDGAMREMGRVEIDGWLHRQMASKAKAMEGGGLMLPLRQATRHRTGEARGATAASAAERVPTAGPQVDGLNDDEDEDAINSDLDDSDDGKDDDDGEDEGGLSNIMLCVYDKVQRVKNKWKCVLKDGILTIDGKEYVFHKATGEYEW